MYDELGMYTRQELQFLLLIIETAVLRCLFSEFETCIPIAIKLYTMVWHKHFSEIITYGDVAMHTFFRFAALQQGSSDRNSSTYTNVPIM